MKTLSSKTDASHQRRLQPATVNKPKKDLIYIYTWRPPKKLVLSESRFVIRQPPPLARGFIDKVLNPK